MANDRRAQGTADNVRRGVKCTHHHTARTFLRTTAAPHSSVSAQGQGDEARGEAPLRSRVRRPRQWLAFDVPRYIRIDRPSKNLNRKVKSLEWDTFLQKRGTTHHRKGRQKGKSHNNGAMPPGGGGEFEFESIRDEREAHVRDLYTHRPLFFRHVRRVAKGF